MSAFRVRRCLLAMVLATVGGSACARTRYVCPPPEPPPNVDSLMHAFGGPLRLAADSSVDATVLAGRVIRAYDRHPVARALVRLRDDTTRSATTDSAGRFALVRPAGARAVTEVRAIGYAARLDTLDLARLAGVRVEFPLYDAYARGDIEGVPVCASVRRRWPF